MDVGRYLVEAHLHEGRPIAQLARDHGVHRSWLYKLLARYRDEGAAGLVARSRRPHRSPAAMPPEVAEEIVRLRAALLAAGLDAGALTIQWHLARDGRRGPSVSSIVRLLRRRGLVVPEPRKRPRSSMIRFEAALPNQLWQTDATHWTLADGSAVEILNFIDDHSRLLVAASCFRTVKAADVVATFHQAADRAGYPAALLSDNGAVFSGASRNGKVLLESELERLGIRPATPGRITPRPAARSSASTRPRSAGWRSSRRPRRSRSSRVSSTVSGSTTTSTARTARSAGGPRRRCSTPR